MKTRRKFLRDLSSGLFIPASFGIIGVRKSLAQVIGGNTSVGGNASYGIIKEGGAAPPSYLVSSNGAATVEVGTGWTDANGATGDITFGSTSPTPLDGAIDIKIVAPNQSCYASFAACDEVYAVCMVKWTAITSATTNWIGIETASAGAFLTHIQQSDTGTVAVYHNDATKLGDMEAIDTNIWYVKLRYKKGNGTNTGISEAELSSNGVFTKTGSRYYGTSTGNGSAQAASIELINFNGAQTCQFDHIRVSTTDLGDWANWT